MNPNITLTIEPGVTVNLNIYYIRIAGILTAVGINADRITIMRSDTSDGFPNDNAGIQFTSTSSPWNETTQIGCIISDAFLSCSTLRMGHMIEINSASPKICNSTIINSGDQRAIFIRDGSPVIVNNSISAKSQCVTITGGLFGYYTGTCTIVDNKISNSEVGIEVLSCSPLIERNLIINNRGSITSGSGGIRLIIAGQHQSLEITQLLSIQLVLISTKT